MFTKKERSAKEKRPHIYKVGMRKPLVIALWVLLAFSLCFAVFKHFTAIDTHTIHESTVVEEKVVDTNRIENFVVNFAKAYYGWEQTSASIDGRKRSLGYYMTSELQALNADTVRIDIPVSSAVTDVQVWSISKARDLFDVTFTVSQLISEGESRNTVTSVYKVTVYMDAAGDMVIVKNPTLACKPTKSDYEPKRAESDGSVDAVTMAEISEFLETFFKMYPSATATELFYYVKEGVLEPVGKEYLFAELLNPVYNWDGNKISVSLAVKYLDERTKTTQISQFDLTLEKSGGNWKIVS